MTAGLGGAEAESGRVRDRLRRGGERAGVWCGAMRGEPAAVRAAGEAPTISEQKIDGVLGVSQADIQRKRVAAI